MKSVILFIYIIPLILLVSCNKALLDEKPNSRVVVPNTLVDFQALLDHNEVNVGNTPELGELSGDNIQLDFQTWQNQYKATVRNSYIWAKDIYAGETEIKDWDQLYKQVFISNIVLEGLTKLTDDANSEAYNRIKGSALFFRAHAFFELAQHFAPPYDKNSSVNELGIPLKVSSNIHERIVRSSVQKTYDQILSDITSARMLLNNPLVLEQANRPNKVAVYGLFSRIFLSMRDYKRAGLYADSSLKLYSNLIDYNTISKTSNSPFSTLRFKHPEVIFDSKAVNGALRGFMLFSNSVVPSDLYNSYKNGDLRKIIFFRVLPSGSITFKFGYAGSDIFTGIATDEMYLNRAECYAREGETNLAMNDLNTLMKKRWDNQAPYPQLSATSAQDALSQILIERRKGLVYRGLRWTDLRRLNKEGANITLKRVLNGQEYLLPPNDPRYVFPIPNDEIALSGIEQNQR